MTTVGSLAERGVENAPVEDFWRASNSACSFGGRRGGDGPVL